MILIYKDGQMSQMKNTSQMTGETIPGDLAGWKYFGTDPNEFMKWTYGKICEMSTTLYHTHPPISAGIEKLDIYTVGPGLVFRSQPDWKMLGVDKSFARDWGMEFQRLIHYYFMMLNFYQKQSSIFRTAEITGDSLLLFERVDKADHLPFDLIDTSGDLIDWQKTGKNITLGMIHDKFSRKLGAVLKTGENILFRDDGDQNFIQYYNRKISRQMRGYPIAYKMIAAAKNNSRWWDALLQRVVMETVMIGYKEGGNPSDLSDMMADLASSVTGESTVDEGLRREAGMAQLSGGNLFSFNSKESIKFTDLKAPSNNFQAMQEAYLELCAMAMDGIPPEWLMSKYSTSFTAHKGALNDSQKVVQKKRANLAKNVCQVVIYEIAKHIFNTGKMKPLHNDFFTDPIIQLATLSGNFLGPVPGHINPKVEVEAKAAEVREAFRTRSDAAADYGNEFDNMIDEWQAQENEWNNLQPDEKEDILNEDLEKLEGAK